MGLCSLEMDYRILLPRAEEIKASPMSTVCLASSGDEPSSGFTSTCCMRESVRAACEGSGGGRRGRGGERERERECGAVRRGTPVCHELDTKRLSPEHAYSGLVKDIWTHRHRRSHTHTHIQRERERERNRQ